jgi:hypothetical protein
MDDAAVLAQQRAEPSHEGVRKLQLACLEHAVKCILHGGYVDDPLLFERDVQWVRGSYECHPNFSFDEICESIEINADRVRAKLLERAEEIRAGIAERRRLGSVTRQRARPEKVEVR